MSKSIVLFDMDGTLTEPRKKFVSTELKSALYDLTNRRIEIGIVTGSSMRYLKQQMGDWLGKSTCRYKTHLLPCNGTQYLRPPMFATDAHKMTYDVSMSEHLGSQVHRKIMKEIIDLQMEISDHNIPLSGHFVDYRGSMINWCPIGREANDKQRKQFVDIDNKLSLRARFLDTLRSQFEWLEVDKQVVVKLGGNTSFDIYPTGWDKRYALRHFPDYDVYFVGDRCEENGNDYELYNHCGEQGYISSGPESTVGIIREIIKNIKEKNGE